MGLLLNVACGGDGARARGAARRAGARPTRAAREPARWGGERSAERIVIAAGGTAGHVVPALAVADALRAEGAEVEFIGGERAEAELVPGGGLSRCTRSSVEGLSRTQPAAGAARAAARGAARVPRARALLRELRAGRGDGRRRLRRRAGRAGRAQRCASRSC